MGKKQGHKCPLCNSKFISADKAAVIGHLAQSLISLYSGLQARAEDEIRTDNPLPCPRCGHSRMSSKTSKNALSRHANIQVCDICGVDEAARVYSDTILPMSSWWAVRQLLSAYESVGAEEVETDSQIVSGEDTEV